MKSVNRQLLVLATGMLIASLIVACGPAPTEAPPAPSPTAPAATTQAEPKRGGTIRVGLLTQAKQFDPHKGYANDCERWVIQLMYDYLVRLDSDLNVEPGLATDWTVSPDGLTWTFNLREGVKFHNGRELKASDVKYSIERIMEPEIASARAKSLIMVQSIEVPDDYTVVFRLSEPNTVLPTSLSHPQAAIVAREIVEQNGDLTQVEAGSGPFKFKGMDASYTVTVERNPDYWQEGLPYLDSIVFIPIPDFSARVAAVRSGDVDMSTFITTNFIALLAEEPGVSLPENQTSGQFYYLSMNNKVEPFNDMKVRQAVAYAIDREALVQIGLNGEGFPLLAGPIPPWHWAALQEPIFPSQDLEKAKQLLAESSHPDGFEFELRIWAPQDYCVRTAEALVEQLAPLNITPKISLEGDWTTYWAPVMEGTYQATIQGDGGNVDPDDWLFERFHCNGANSISKYCNPQVDELLEQGRRQDNQADRKETYDEAQRIMASEAAQAFLYNMKQTEAYRDYVKGFYHMPTMTLEALTITWLDK